MAGKGKARAPVGQGEETEQQRKRARREEGESAASRAGGGGDGSSDEDEPAEIELNFEGEQPDASDLYEMAAEERADDNAEIAIKLFERALAKFEEEDEAHEKKDGKEYGEFVLTWAHCMREFGEYYPLKEYLQRARTKFASLVDREGMSTSFKAKACIGLGRTELTLALMEHEDLVAAQQADAPADAEELPVAPSAEETELYEQGVAHYEQAFPLMSSASKRADEMALLAKYLVSYAAVQSAGPHQQAVYRKALASSEAAAGLAPKDHFVLTVHGSALHGLASALATARPADALDLANRSVQSYRDALAAVEDPEDTPADLLKGLGDALILKSTLLEDDGQVLDAYDEGVSFLRKAYERNPSNSELYDLLVQMGKADDLPVEPAGDDQGD